MNDDEKTKEQLVQELSELRLQNAALEKSITGHASTQLAVEEASRYAENIVETIRLPLLVLDEDLKVMLANKYFYSTFKVTPGETLGTFIYDLGNKQWDIPILRELLEKILPEKGVVTNFEVFHDFPDIGRKTVLLNACQIHRKNIAVQLILVTGEDITRRKQLENSLADSEKIFRRLFESANDVIVLLEKREGIITHSNVATEKMLGYSEQECIGSKLQDIGVMLDTGDFHAIIETLKLSGIINYSDIIVTTKTGKCVNTDIYLVDRSSLVQCNIRDVTERKRVEEALTLNSTRTQALLDLHLLSNNPQQAILDFVLEAAQQACRSQFSFIGLIDETESFMTIHAWSKDAMAQCSSVDKPIHFPIAEAGLWGDCVRQRNPVTVNDYEAPWPGRKGYPEGHVPIRRFLGVPVFDGNKIVAVAAVANKEDPYMEDDHHALISLVNKMWEILRRKQAEQKLQDTLESLRKAFGTTVHVLVSAVETRDPYTSGHQIRSADLARAIATEMKLSQEKIDGIRMAGSIHDIGKMSIPSEILSKPTKLSELEFSLIKEHAKKGFDMLKDVESPWPLAEIVYQHHERMDGSGYPRQLKGKEIIMEARILAVADVVESMASYRPYRPALGLNAALAEIEINKVKLYDADAVDACLRLFREKGYQFG